jgi:hypothetical protein
MRSFFRSLIIVLACFGVAASGGEVFAKTTKTKTTKAKSSKAKSTKAKNTKAKNTKAKNTKAKSTKAKGKGKKTAKGKKKPVVNCAAFHIDVKAHDPVGAFVQPDGNGVCTPGTRGEFPVPDQRCSPGAINTSVTLEVLQNPRFRTSCLRDRATSAQQKHKTYGWYALKAPPNNSGLTMVCELDHIISLELGGADTLDNIWPQCGPSRAALQNRYFKQKDVVENYLAYMVKNGNMSLTTAQRGIAFNWPQFLDHANQICPKGACPRH